MASLGSCYAGLGVSLLAVGLVGCGKQHDAFVQAIPGTEQVCPPGYSITVSPDERWLSFREWKLPRAVVIDDLPPGEYFWRIATLDMKSGSVVRHSIDSLGSLLFSPGDQSERRQAEFEIVENLFRPPGWIDGRFYLQRYGSEIYLMIEPSQPEIRMVSRPESPATCSDCPPVPIRLPTYDWRRDQRLVSPPVDIEFRNRLWDPLSEDVSIVLREGAVRSVYYRGEGPYRTHMICRLGESGDEEIVVERSEKRGVFATVATVRASPDEQYLAYVEHSKKQAFFAPPTDRLFIRVLDGGREIEISAHYFIGNLIWSPDGERLYFAAGEYSSDSAVRVVDVKATFSD